MLILDLWPRNMKIIVIAIFQVFQGKKSYDFDVLFWIFLRELMIVGIRSMSNLKEREKLVKKHIRSLISIPGGSSIIKKINKILRFPIFTIRGRWVLDRNSKQKPFSRK